MFKNLGNLGGLGNLANVGNLMKQVQEMQSKLESIEEELAGERVHGTAGGGMVTVVANGKQEILDISIEQELLTAEEVDMVQDMIVAATNQALDMSRERRAQKMSALTGGLKIPGLI